jgi:hypothetical protein
LACLEACPSLDGVTEVPGSVGIAFNTVEVFQVSFPTISREEYRKLRRH